MTALAGDFFSARTKSGDSAQLRTNVTHSGFSVTVVPRSKYDQAFLAEMIFKLVGVLLIPAGGIALFLPKIVDGPAYVATQIGMLAAFIFLGVAIHRRADRGFGRRVLVDSARGDLRIGSVNVAGDFHLLSVYKVTDIESFFIVRSRDGVTPAVLKMRLKLGAQTISLFEGSERVLVPLLERVTLALNPPKMKNRKYRTKTAGGFIRMTFD